MSAFRKYPFDVLAFEAPQCLFHFSEFTHRKTMDDVFVLNIVWKPGHGRRQGSREPKWQSHDALANKRATESKIQKLEQTKAGPHVLERPCLRSRIRRMTDVHMKPEIFGEGSVFEGTAARHMDISSSRTCRFSPSHATPSDTSQNERGRSRSKASGVEQSRIGVISLPRFSGAYEAIMPICRRDVDNVDQSQPPDEMRAHKK
jgi:hypothetical protein